jgi:HTH-type transcriptional regulator/antitoxin HigA
MSTVTVSVIKSNKDYKEAVKQIENLWGSKPGTPRGEKLDALMTLVDAYEAERWPWLED